MESHFKQIFLVWKTTLVPSLFPMVPDYSVVSAQIPGGDPAQFHGQFLDQPLVSGCGESDSVSRITGELLVCTNSCQHHLRKLSNTKMCQWEL